MAAGIYPPSIQGAPPDLTRPSGQYRRQVVIVLLSLAAFVAFYFGLIAGSVWVIGKAVAVASADSGERGSGTRDGFGIAAVLAAILLVFLVKALFKWRREQDETRIEVTEPEYPELFQFIRRICEDTKAPFPKKVYVTPDVNAAVFYHSSLLSLILPVKKNLVIGLGLVNGLNLSEFKAVLAHEFGHFSQSSMRLGSYVYTANQVICDLVYQRDVFDDLLAKARRTNIRIAIFAWLATFILWLLRTLLQFAFRIINLFQSALSRQMEFQADLVAVSVTGSDALIHALKKLEFVQDCLVQAVNDVKEAAEHKLYTADLFYHQSRAADHLRRVAAKADIGAIPELPTDPADKRYLFTKEEQSGEADGMWASHPSHYDREQNAKRCYLRSPEDTRSPWILFGRSEPLRRKMTALLYKSLLDFTPADATLAAPETVQAFIDQEHEETLQDARYGGLFDGRLLSIPVDQLTSLANDPSLPAMPEMRIRALIDRLYDTGMKDWGEAHYKRREEQQTLAAIESGDAPIKGNHFEYRGRTYPKSEVKNLREMIEQELEADAETLEEFDREVFLVHLRMGQMIGQGDSDLFARYYFHLHLQEMLKTTRGEELRLMGLFQYAASKQEGLSASDVAEARAMLSDARSKVLANLEKYGSTPLPALKNMTEGVALARCLLDEPLVGPQPGPEDRIDGEWAGALAKQVSQMEERSRRLYFKSMGAILARQETIAAAWREQNSDPAITGA